MRRRDHLPDAVGELLVVSHGLDRTGRRRPPNQSCLRSDRQASVIPPARGRTEPQSGARRRRARNRRSRVGRPPWVALHIGVIRVIWSRSPLTAGPWQPRLPRDQVRVDHQALPVACLRHGMRVVLATTLTPTSASALTLNAEALPELRAHDGSAA
jgi:hypothetical protein